MWEFPREHLDPMANWLQVGSWCIHASWASLYMFQKQDGWRARHALTILCTSICIELPGRSLVGRWTGGAASIRTLQDIANEELWFPLPTPRVFVWMTLSMANQKAIMLYRSEVTARKKLGSGLLGRPDPAHLYCNLSKQRSDTSYCPLASNLTITTGRQTWSLIWSTRVHQDKSRE